ncbi:MAG: hypothetical protein ACXADA_09565 [Candidatus Hodarchaeales archaeon]|jgi:hypothetical protein
MVRRFYNIKDGKAWIELEIPVKQEKAGFEKKAAELREKVKKSKMRKQKR